MTTICSSRHVIERGANLFPLSLFPAAKTAKLFDGSDTGPKPNLSDQAVDYLRRLGFGLAAAKNVGTGSPACAPSPKAAEIPAASRSADSLERLSLQQGAEALFFHILAVLHAPAYRAENVGALRQDWPRIPLPATRESLEASADLGRQLAALLDPLQPVKGITTGKVRPELKAIGLITKNASRGTGILPVTEHGQDAHATGQIDADSGDLAVTAGWGNPGRGGITMPAGGKCIERPYSPDELAAWSAITAGGGCATLLGEKTCDIYLNDNVCWRNVPKAVWSYTLGGYQVIKKWLWNRGACHFVRR